MDYIKKHASDFARSHSMYTPRKFAQVVRTEAMMNYVNGENEHYFIKCVFELIEAEQIKHEEDGCKGCSKGDALKEKVFFLREIIV